MPPRRDTIVARKRSAVVYNASRRFDDVAYGFLMAWRGLDTPVPLRECARRLNVPHSTIQYWSTKESPPSATVREAPQPTRCSEQYRRLAVKLVQTTVKIVGTRLTPKLRKARTRTTVRAPHGSVRAVAREINHRAGKVVISKSTVHRYLIAADLKAYVVQRRPRLSQKNRDERLAFCVKLLSPRKGLSINIDIVVFTDEKWFDSNDGRVFEWVPRRRPRGGCRKSRLTREVEQGPPRLMVWGAIGKGFRRLVRVPASADGKQKAVKVDHQVYLDLCAKPFREIRRAGMILQQDNCSSHKHENVTKFFKRIGIETLDEWPGCSPDLSPIENVWAMVAGEVTKEGPYGPDELWEYVLEKFMNIPEETICRLIDGFERRLRLCKAERGGTVTKAVRDAARWQL